MKRTNANTVVGRFKRVFSEQELNRLGKEVMRYCQRECVASSTSGQKASVTMRDFNLLRGVKATVA